jgi:protein-S-isoprenylcysteine O-methyltransferase Ste14/pimeloyl-ACP methyl ester carboxylesterase
MLIRALVAFLALPGVVAFGVPLALAWSAGRLGSFRWPALILLVPGSALLLWTVRDFLVIGKGTLAPWGPPRHLVTTGLYRVSRNPMYLAVMLILTGWAMAFGSLFLLAYAAVVLIAFQARVITHEEPRLARTHRDEWPRYSARVPRWILPNRAAVVAAWVAVLVAIPIGGLIYEAIADGLAQREFAAPGMLVDIGGRRLHLLCIGEGEPIVFFEHSGWGSSLSSREARERVASRTTVCSYDRSGSGWSDPGPDTASAGSLARDLAVLQDRAQLAGPFVIVASSIGGLTAEMFARQYPERTAGLVFLDAASSLTLPLRESEGRFARPAVCGASMLARFGVLRLLNPFSMESESDEGRRAAALTYNPRPWTQLCAMGRGLPDTVREFEQAPALPPDIPLAVLSASSSEELMPPSVRRFVDVEALRQAIVDSHRQLAATSSRGTWAVVPDSTHLIGGSQPDAVADAVLDMLEGIR